MIKVLIKQASGNWLVMPCGDGWPVALTLLDDADAIVVANV